MTREALYDKAIKARSMYRSGLLTRKEAIKEIEPYTIMYNEKSKEIAKKFNQNPKLMSIPAFLR